VISIMLCGKRSETSCAGRKKKVVGAMLGKGKSAGSGEGRGCLCLYFVKRKKKGGRVLEDNALSNRGKRKVDCSQGKKGRHGSSTSFVEDP